MWVPCVPDTRVFLTIAVDLVIVGIQEPVRFLIETKAKIFPTNERFWYFSKKPHQDTFILTLKDVRVSNLHCFCRKMHSVGCQAFM